MCKKDALEKVIDGFMRWWTQLVSNCHCKSIIPPGPIFEHPQKPRFNWWFTMIYSTYIGMNQNYRMIQLLNQSHLNRIRRICSTETSSFPFCESPATTKAIQNVARNLLVTTGQDSFSWSRSAQIIPAPFILNTSILWSQICVFFPS